MTAPSTPWAALRASDHPFLAGMDPGLVEAIGRGAVERSFGTGELLCRDGAPAEEFFLIFEGKVALEAVAPDRPHLTTQTVGPGEVLGWSWLVPPFRWPIDVRALKPTRTVTVPAGDLRRLLEDRPADGFRFLLRLLPVIAERLENTRVRLLDIHAP